MDRFRNAKKRDFLLAEEIPTGALIKIVKPFIEKSSNPVNDTLKKEFPELWSGDDDDINKERP